MTRTRWSGQGFLYLPLGGPTPATPPPPPPTSPVNVVSAHVTTATPVPGWRYFGLFALLGIYVGVIPVFLGLLWFPFLTAVRGRWIEGLLSFTVGLLPFLGLDALKEAFKAVEQLGPGFKGEAVILLGLFGTFFGLVALGGRGQ